MTGPRSYVYKSVPLAPETARKLRQAQQRRGLPAMAAAVRHDGPVTHWHPNARIVRY